MVLPPLTFMVSPTINVRGGNTILSAPKVPKNYSLETTFVNLFSS